ncbi:MAG: TetR/AcrR family transcriptional regulator [Pseudomonadota bacterium]
MPRRSDARGKLMKTASVLFRRQGYHGTGLTQILDESGAPKGSFYYHFPGGKEELAAVATEEAGGEISDVVDRAFSGARTFEDGAAALIDTIAGWFEKSGYTMGCPITSVLLETVPGSDRLRGVTRDVLNDWTTRVAAHAEADGFRAEDAATIGDAMLMSLEGAWILARARQDRTAFDNAARTVTALASAMRG